MTTVSDTHVGEGQLALQHVADDVKLHCQLQPCHLTRNEVINAHSCVSNFVSRYILLLDHRKPFVTPSFPARLSFDQNVL